jgi:predicted nuclease of predicted toxin-antitoxin system
MLTGQPALLLISIGNISNNDLERLLQVNLHLVSEAFRDHRFVEITHDGLITHE